MRRSRDLAVVVVAAALLAVGCGRGEPQLAEEYEAGRTPEPTAAKLHPSAHGRQLLQRCPLPPWWDEVEAPRIGTYSELLKYWQGQSFTPEQLFKVCYTAIVEHLDDDPPDLAMLAVSLISHGDPTWRHYGELYRFVLDLHFDYDRPLARYGGKAGDTVAGIVEDYAGLLNGEGRYEEARDLIERLLAERRKEVNPQLLQLVSLELADAYVGLGQRSRARAVLTQALTYPGDWGDRIRARLDSL